MLVALFTLSLHYFQYTPQPLAHSRCSLNIRGMEGGRAGRREDGPEVRLCYEEAHPFQQETEAKGDWALSPLWLTQPLQVPLLFL